MIRVSAHLTVILLVCAIPYTIQHALSFDHCITRITLIITFNFYLTISKEYVFSKPSNFQQAVREDPTQLVKLENIMSLALHLREVAEDFQKKKVRDILDFEWVRNPR